MGVVAVFTCLSIVSFERSSALSLGRQAEHRWTVVHQNSTRSLQSKWGQSLVPMSKSTADENVLLSLRVAEAADGSSWAKDAFVEYSEDDTTVSALPTYFFFYGSALGMYRDGENPPGDDDVDVAMPFWEMLSVSDTLRQQGIRPIKSPHHWGGYGESTRSSFWGYAFNENGSHVCFGPSGATFRDAFPVEMLLPVRKISVPNITALKGHVVNVPRKPEQVLPLLYGEHWRTPSSSKGPPIAANNMRYDRNCAVLRKGQW